MKTLARFFSSPSLLYQLNFNGVSNASRSSLHRLLRQKRRDVNFSSRMQTRWNSSEVEIMSEYERGHLPDEGKVLEKDAALHFAVSQIASGFGEDSMLSLQRFFGSRHVPVISTGSLKLDLALGIGGLPKGRMVEIYGREASGKTTLALHIVAEAQKLGGYCAYLDAENALDPSLAESLGVNTENLLIARPDSAENSLSIVDTLVKSASLDVIVVDSVAALVPQCELDSSTFIDAQSWLLTQALRRIHSSLSRSQTLLILVNQVRLNTGSFLASGHPRQVTCGGNALRFYAAIRLNIMRMGLLRTEDEVTGMCVSVQVAKNKLAPSMKTAELQIGFGKGFRRETEVFEVACEHGFISKSRYGYNIEGEVFKDKAEAVLYLAENDWVLDQLHASLRNQLFKSETESW